MSSGIFIFLMLLALGLWVWCLCSLSDKSNSPRVNNALIVMLILLSVVIMGCILMICFFPPGRTENVTYIIKSAPKPGPANIHIYVNLRRFL